MDTEQGEEDDAGAGKDDLLSLIGGELARMRSELQESKLARAAAEIQLQNEAMLVHAAEAKAEERLEMTKGALAEVERLSRDSEVLRGDLEATRQEAARQVSILRGELEATRQEAAEALQSLELQSKERVAHAKALTKLNLSQIFERQLSEHQRTSDEALRESREEASLARQATTLAEEQMQQALCQAEEAKRAELMHAGEALRESRRNAVH